MVKSLSKTKIEGNSKPRVFFRNQQITKWNIKHIFTKIRNKIELPNITTTAQTLFWRQLELVGQWPEERGNYTEWGPKKSAWKFPSAPGLRTEKHMYCFCKPCHWEAESWTEIVEITQSLETLALYPSQDGEHSKS